MINFLGNFILLIALVIFLTGFIVASVKDKKVFAYLGSTIGIILTIICFVILN